MKKFFVIDFWVQLSVFIAVTIYLLIKYFAFNKDNEWIFFHFIVGGTQLFSFFIKSFSNYKKSILFKIYTITILPIWLSLLFIFPFGNINSIAYVLLMILIFGIFSSPISAVLYIIESYLTYKNQQLL